MQFSIDIGCEPKTAVEFKRNWFTGRTTITIDGNEKTLKDPYSLSTHIDLEFTKRWEFSLENPEAFKLVVEQIRPVLFGGFQPHQYNVYVDDSLVLEKCGY
ncbi:hypothetical protein [Gimesia fumaroli]|jgi:hypothetical protein|uniref:Uncharacterized protein n=1 Tax=Gimesia fumaroli TaxID=2527976 RepID=A0A518IC56_9PLAN|nr:hypothetical protein [Gimesia fumaroli]QDV50692.1 hypothetical protein Enr17x_27340 [Gimesia fumaroli]